MSHLTPQPSQPHGHETFEPGHHPGHEHPDFLAHHWDTPQQQFEAGKLGMWLFLATEVLLFGGLFCAYSVWRGNHPELFRYGSTFLNTTLGAVNTAVLILSSLTMAWGVTAAQQNKQGLLKVMLILTLAGAATFLVIKYFEYTHKFHEGWYPGVKFYSVPEHSEMFWGAHGHDEAARPHEPGADSAEHASGLRMDDVGSSTMGQAQGRATVMGSGATGQPAGAQGAAAAAPTQVSMAPGLPPVDAPRFPPAAKGPSGLVANVDVEPEPVEIIQEREQATVHPLRDPNRPKNAHMFFNIYFMMTGLHGIHVVVGMIVITWLLIKTHLGHFSSEYFTPVDLGGLYWHIVDLIWIFLFPLFYLI